jgi:methionyl-tRNA synthetase
MSDSPTPPPAAPAAPAATAVATAPAAPQAPAAPAAATGDGRITFDDLMKVDLRVAKVLAAERVPKSSKLLKLSVDVGTETRTIVAGLGEAYEPEAMVGRTIAIVANLAPRKMMGIESNGMVLAGGPDGAKPELVTFADPPPPPGSRIR